MWRSIRAFVFSWWGWILVGAIVLFWIGLVAVVILGQGSVVD
jgi:hypothetical protein